MGRFSQLYIKDESVNPTGSFKARGLSAAVKAARARGIKALEISTAGNAGGALSAYAAALRAAGRRFYATRHAVGFCY